MKIHNFIAKFFAFSNNVELINKKHIVNNKIGNWIIDEENIGFKWVDGHGKWVLNKKTYKYEWITDN